MIVWKGWGILILPITLLCMLFTYLIFQLIPIGQENVHIALGFFLAAVAVWYAGKYFNRNSDRVYTNEETGEKIKLGAHSFFFIRMEYWAFILPVVGLFAIILG